MDKPGAAPNDEKCAETNKLGYRSNVVASAVQLLRRTLPIAMMLLAVIAVPLLVLEPEGLPRLHGLERELDEVTTENQELRRNIERLRIEVQRLREDPAAVERIARSELGMVRKTEVVFQFGR
jgi:cell division protein FtsB